MSTQEDRKRLFEERARHADYLGGATACDAVVSGVISGEDYREGHEDALTPEHARTHYDNRYPEDMDEIIAWPVSGDDMALAKAGVI